MMQQYHVDEHLEKCPIGPNDRLDVFRVIQARQGSHCRYTSKEAPVEAVFSKVSIDHSLCEREDLLLEEL